MNKNNNSLTHEQQQVNVSQSVRPSLFKTLEGVYTQVEFESFGRMVQRGRGEYARQVLEFDPLYKELCLIIAEIYIKPPESTIRIQGQPTEVYLVQEVYRALEHEHLEQIVNKFKEQGHRIHNKKAYLQTSLYNIVFEFDAGITNELRAAGLIQPNNPKGGA